jgi:hypothetical protein
LLAFIKTGEQIHHNPFNKVVINYCANHDFSTSFVATLISLISFPMTYRAAGMKDRLLKPCKFIFQKEKKTSNT